MTTRKTQHDSPAAGAKLAPGFAGLALALTVAILAIRAVVDVNLIAPAMRYIEGGFSASRGDVLPIVPAYGITSVVSFAALSIGASRFSRNSVYLISTGGFAVASVLCGMATSTEMLRIFRILEGLAAGALIAASISTFVEIFSPARRLGVELALGLGCLLAGPITGPTIAGYLTDNLSWRWIFLLNFPISVVAGIFALFVFPKVASGSSNQPAQDWPRIVSMTLGLGAWNYFFGAHVWV